MSSETVGQMLGMSPQTDWSSVIESLTAKLAECATVDEKNDMEVLVRDVHRERINKYANCELKKRLLAFGVKC